MIYSAATARQVDAGGWIFQALLALFDYIKYTDDSTSVTTVFYDLIWSDLIHLRASDLNHKETTSLPVTIGKALLLGNTGCGDQ